MNYKTPLSAAQLVANFSSPQVRAPIVSQPVYTVANNFPVYRILPQVDCLKTDQTKPSLLSNPKEQEKPIF